MTILAESFGNLRQDMKKPVLWVWEENNGKKKERKDCIHTVLQYEYRKNMLDLTNSRFNEKKIVPGPHTFSYHSRFNEKSSRE